MGENELVDLVFAGITTAHNNHLKWAGFAASQLPERLVQAEIFKKLGQRYHEEYSVRIEVKMREIEFEGTGRIDVAILKEDETNNIKNLKFALELKRSRRADLLAPDIISMKNIITKCNANPICAVASYSSAANVETLEKNSENLRKMLRDMNIAATVHTSNTVDTLNIHNQARLLQATVVAIRKHA